jgi:hypothetical protein
VPLLLRPPLCGLVSLIAAILIAQPAPAHAEEENTEPPWYERLEIGGYTQIRYNRLYASNPDLVNEEADPAIAPPSSISLRRARLIVEGDLSWFLHLYLQPEFAGTVEDELHVVEIRDWYGDVSLVRDQSLRVRVGQSKVPFSFESMQSSQDRLAFDRSDALNSAIPNERDIGVFVMWAPAGIRDRFKRLDSRRMKGSGDYGVATLGLFNGQGMNERERNANKHVTARVSYPIALGDQVIELGGGGFAGRFVPERSDGVGGPREIRDVRVGGQFVLYPKPFGLQAEYNVGVGPERVGDQVLERPLEGGYATVTAHVGPTFPYVRVQRYDGGWKALEDAPRRVVHELEAGVEWHVADFLELTGAWVESVRTVDGDRQYGQLARLQAQLNY